MPNPYPADFDEPDGTVRWGGFVNFTDPGNQPAGGLTPVSIDDGDSPYQALAGQLVVVGDLGDDVTILLPDDPDVPLDGTQVAVVIQGDPDGNTVTVSSEAANGINGAATASLASQYQTLSVIFSVDEWLILESGEGVAEVFSVFAATGNVLPGWAVAGTALNAGGALAMGANPITSSGDVTMTGGTFANDATSTVAQLVTTLAAQPADGTLAASQTTFWLDSTNGAAVLHIKAKQADGTVVGAAIPLA